jgi:cellobiose phosphorylase
LSFLNKQITYYDKEKDIKSRESGMVLDHLKRALAFTKNSIGKHGLPLLGFADWNDCVNLPKGAESIFNACLYGKDLLEMIDLSKKLGEKGWVEGYTNDYEAMKAKFNESCWDGEWFVRWFDANDTPLGSKTNKYGKIYINAQSWSVIAGFASPEKARRALDSVKEKLNTSKGIKLSTPGFNGYDTAYGGITTYPPGAKENGGIFLHSNPWVMIAETIMGNGEMAYMYYDQINPAKKNDIIDEYECEPYVYPQNILGDEHPQFGLARNSWLSGTSSWTYQAATKYILGILPQYDGLMIDPCIPKSWDGFSIDRYFRGALYKIVVKNPGHVSKGVGKVLVNGKQISGNIVAAAKSGETVNVEVTLASV